MLPNTVRRVISGGNIFVISIINHIRGKNVWLVSLLLLITHVHPLFVGKNVWLVSLLLLITHAHPLFVGKNVWLVSLLLLITHAHPLGKNVWLVSPCSWVKMCG